MPPHWYVEDTYVKSEKNTKDCLLNEVMRE